MEREKDLSLGSFHHSVFITETVRDPLPIKTFSFSSLLLLVGIFYSISSCVVNRWSHLDKSTNIRKWNSPVPASTHSDVMRKSFSAILIEFFSLFLPPRVFFGWKSNFKMIELMKNSAARWNIFIIMLFVFVTNNKKKKSASLKRTMFSTCLWWSVVI